MDKAKRCKWLIALSLLMSSSLAFADWSALNMRQGVTEISQEVYGLHMIMFWVCVVIGVLVFGTMIISMLMHRKSLGVKPATFHDNTTIEIAWTIVPIIILVVLAIPATTTLTKMYDTGDTEMDIEVRGLQWKWQYTYLNDDPSKEISFISSMITPQEEIYNRAPKRENYLLDVDNELVIPIDTRIRFLITSGDVIHSWWVPDFALKKDAIPGFIHELWTIVDTPGTYRGKCTELCGPYHGFMPVVVRAVEKDEYAAWLLEQQAEAEKVFEIVGKQWSEEELMVEGEEVYLRACASCHQVNGRGLPPAFPSLVGQGLAVGPIEDHIDIVLNGKPGSAMQSFSKQLNAAEIAAVITYERKSWGNQAESVQPKEIFEMLEAQ
ncbi:MAG: cytochrome c oxidase subunit II [Pseudomonadales bacterium]|jgi:cytochrome c oxidase subunit 2|tara:strand:- start:2602 stop:3741 length:1140 start_codon:yes stop_codon:yes gene_type:complete